MTRHALKLSANDDVILAEREHLCVRDDHQERRGVGDAVFSRIVAVLERLESAHASFRQWPVRRLEEEMIPNLRGDCGPPQAGQAVRADLWRDHGGRVTVDAIECEASRKAYAIRDEGLPDDVWLEQQTTDQQVSDVCIRINRQLDVAILELGGARRDATALWALLTDTIGRPL
jgi:hypothetical protein